MPYPLTNVLLDALPETSRRRLLRYATRIAIPIRTSLYEPDQDPKFAHFLLSGMASVVITAESGSTTEIGTLGREGVPQAVHLLGTTPLSSRCFMQMPGLGYRLAYSDLQHIFASDESVRQVLLRYVQYQSAMVGQVAGCNRLHGAEARLARWLLMIRDRTESSVLKLTQEFLAEMIGSQRTTVSDVASALQRQSLIRYARGTIRIADAAGLEQVACGCYSVMRKLLRHLYQQADQAAGMKEPSTSSVVSGPGRIVSISDRRL